MSMEPTFVALLQVRCPRVYPVAAPVNTERPYITWQHIGGQSLRFVDNTAADKRHTMVQVNVWHSTLASAGRNWFRKIGSTTMNAAPKKLPMMEPMPPMITMNSS